MLDPDITAEMIQAGTQICNDMCTANCAKNLKGLGGCKTWQEFKDSNPDNFDLLERHVNDEITSVEGIFLAMSRASQKS